MKLNDLIDELLQEGTIWLKAESMYQIFPKRKSDGQNIVIYDPEWSYAVL